MANRFRLDGRASGILLHPTSLFGSSAIGDLGPAADAFADWLQDAGQRWWQMLPVGPPGMAHSPYDAQSAFAGNPMLISLARLVDDGWLPTPDLAIPAGRTSGRVDYDAAEQVKEPQLRQAFAAFNARAGRKAVTGFERFRTANQSWLADFALYRTLKEIHQGSSWVDWRPDLRTRRESALAAAREQFAEEIRYHEFVQFLFDRQWSALRAYCHDRGIGLIGDMPIYVAHDSADVWSHQSLFTLDRSGRPARVAGVKPDYFSKSGQLWGNPLYRWDVLKASGYDWWLARLATLFQRFDAVRLDHFIGFQRYWEIPGGAKSARTGRWRTGPGAELFERVRTVLGPVQLIAEDLGLVTPEVRALRDQFGLPGMRVLQFGFGSDADAHEYLPHNYPRHCVAYTGTHDNDTAVGWFRDSGVGSTTRTTAEIREQHSRALQYLGGDAREFHWDMIRAVQVSVANTVIIPMQDVLGLGSATRMNRPGVGTGNWAWRLLPGQLDTQSAHRLRRLAEAYGRLS